MDEVVLPSLSLLPSNCGMAEELWAMIKALPYERRYVMFAGHVVHLFSMGVWL